MKYVNSLKYMNCFEYASDMSEVSVKRTLELCELIGRVHVGNRVIYIPSGPLGYATAVMLESVIKNEGYKVGRITSEFGADSRSSVYINGERASIDDYNRAVAEIKTAVSKSSDQGYFSQETVFAMSLLICKMNACEYVILQGMSDAEHDPASLCTPYDIVIAPTVCEGDDSAATLSNAIRHGVREVISGTQRKGIYDLISKACFACGARLTFVSRTGFITESLSSIEHRFNYGFRGGYSVKSPSESIAECAMLAIESALAIRRSGVKLTWTSILSGLASASGMGCFEIMSASPLVLLDSAENESELSMFISTLDNIFVGEEERGAAVCVPAGALHLIGMLEKYRPSSYIIVGGVMTDRDSGNKVFPDSVHEAAKLIIQNMKDGIDTLCFGSVAFEYELKSEITKLMS